jgi:hypothetical protein
MDDNIPDKPLQSFWQERQEVLAYNKNDIQNSWLFLVLGL